MAGFISELSNMSGNYICYNLDTLATFVESVLDYYKDLSYVKFYYAIKANSDDNVLKLLSTKVEGADCASIEEIELALTNGFKTISVTCPGFEGKTISKLLMKNIHFDVDNIEQLLDADLNNVSIGIRVNPQIGTSRFGIIEKDLPKIEYLSSRGITIDTLHVHYGHKTEENIDKLLIFIKIILSKNDIFKNIRTINLGGGIEGFYINGKKDYLKDAIIHIYDMATAILGHEIEIVIEPGSLLSLPIGYLKTEVKYVNNNDVFLSFSKFNLGDWNELNILAINGQELKSNTSEAGINYRFLGNTCYENDVFGEYNISEIIKKTDNVIFYPVGAYNYSLMRNLHSMKKPKIIYFLNGVIVNG